MLEQANRRMDRVERRLSQLHQNPAPTVPEYDLQGIPSASPWLFTVNNVDVANLTPLLANTDYSIELHAHYNPSDSSTYVESYINGVHAFRDTTGDGNPGHIPSIIEIGWSYVFILFNGTGAADTTPHYQFWDLSVGTTRGASDLFSNSLSSIPTVPPFTGSGYTQFQSGAANIVIHNSMSVLDVTLIDVNNDEVFGKSVGNQNDLWVTFNMNFPPEFLTWLEIWGGNVIAEILGTGSLGMQLHSGFF